MLSGALLYFDLNSFFINLPTFRKLLNVFAKNARKFLTSDASINPKIPDEPSDKKNDHHIRRDFGKTAIESGIVRFVMNREIHFSDLCNCTDISLSCWFQSRIIHWLNVS